MSDEILVRLTNIETMLRQALSAKEVTQECYSTSDAAKILGKAEWTVREWCRLGRVNAEKRASGRGTAKEWMIGHAELCRIRSEGLLPLRSDIRR